MDNSAEKKDKLLKKQEKKRQKQKRKNLKYSSPAGVRKRLVKRIAILAIVVIVIAAIVTGIVVLSNGTLQRRLTAFTVGDEDFSVADYNYWFQTLSDQMASTAYMYPDRETVIRNITAIVAVAKSVEKMGGTLSEEDLAAYNSVIEKVVSEAKSYQGGENAFYNDTYGFGTNEEVVRKNYWYQALAVSYHNEFCATLNYTQSDYDDYYNSDGNKVLSIMSFRSCIFAPDDSGTLGISYGSSAAANEAAKSFEAKLTGSDESFGNAVKEELEANNGDAESFDYNSTLQEDFSASNFDGNLIEIRDWLLSSERKEGDHATFTATVDGIERSYVIMAVTMPHPETYKTVDARHILVSTTSENSELSEDELKKAASENLDSIKAKWEATDKSDSAFAELAKKYSEDGTAEYGGLMEKIYKGQLVDSMDTWLFDESRKPGDYSVVESTYGYHLVYYKGTNVEKWIVDAQSYMFERDFEIESERICSLYGVESKFNETTISMFADEMTDYA